MITSKDRATLKSIVSTENPIAQVGKDGLSKNCIEGINQALTKREVVKINVLQNCDLTPREVADFLQEVLSCEVVGVIGRKIILYKFNKDNKIKGVVQITLFCCIFKL